MAQPPCGFEPGDRDPALQETVLTCLVAEKWIETRRRGIDFGGGVDIAVPVGEKSESNMSKMVKNIIDERFNGGKPIIADRDEVGTVRQKTLPCYSERHGPR